MPAKGVLLAVTADVVVAGGGVIGTAIAWRAAAAGLDTVLVDPAHGDAASLVAAGMLAPVSEALFGEGALLRINLLAVARFGSFAAELEEVTGHRVGLRREGTLAVAYDPGDYAALMRLTAFRRSAGLDAEELDSRACRKLESFLTPDVHGGVLFPGDWSVDNRRYAAALREAAAAAKVRIVRDRVTEVLIRDGRARGVRLADGGEIGSAQVVVAAGCWSGAVAGLPEAGAGRGPAGQGPAAAAAAPGRDAARHQPHDPGHGARRGCLPGAAGRRRGGRGRDPGRTRAGPDGDRGCRARPAARRHERAPGDERADPGRDVRRAAAGHARQRPDRGRVRRRGGLLLATGHYRNGILMSPVTADAIVACLTGQPPAAQWEPFTPERFAGPGGSAVSLQVKLNGEPRELPDGSTIAQAVAELTAAPAGVAAALNGDVVPRGSWAATPLRDGDQVEVVTAVQGG